MHKKVTVVEGLIVIENKYVHIEKQNFTYRLEKPDEWYKNFKLSEKNM